MGERVEACMGTSDGCVRLRALACNCNGNCVHDERSANQGGHMGSGPCIHTHTSGLGGVYGARKVRHVSAHALGQMQP